MNIQKTNKLGIEIVKKGFIGGNKTIIDIQNSHQELNDTSFLINSNLLRHNPKAKIIRVSKGIMDACKLIDIESIKENIDKSNFDFMSLFILLDNDISGIIKVERYGNDFSFIMLSNLNIFGNKIDICYNSYSFLSKSFYVEKEDINNIKLGDGRNIINYKKSVFVIQLLTYLIFGDITEKFLKPKMSVNINLNRFLNNSKLGITFCDTLWKQRINTEGFKVRGHFRLQPVGEGRQKRKLIWIEEFDKKGYHRRATVEIA